MAGSQCPRYIEWQKCRNTLSVGDNHHLQTLVGRCLNRNEDQWSVCDDTALDAQRQYCFKNHLGVDVGFLSSAEIRLLNSSELEM